MSLLGGKTKDGGCTNLMQNISGVSVINGDQIFGVCFFALLICPFHAQA